MENTRQSAGDLTPNKDTVMYVVMGYTKGDDLIHSEAKPLFASPDFGECETKMFTIEKERDEWLSKNTVPQLVECSIFARFKIVKTPF